MRSRSRSREDPRLIESHPTELWYKDLIRDDGSKILNKRNAIFFNLILSVIANGIGKSYYSIQLKLAECGFFINIPNLKKVLEVLELDGYIEFNSLEDTDKPSDSNSDKSNDRSS